MIWFRAAVPGVPLRTSLAANEHAENQYVNRGAVGSMRQRIAGRTEPSPRKKFEK
jgi:hypothetical protein